MVAMGEVPAAERARSRRMLPLRRAFEPYMRADTGWGARRGPGAARFPAMGVE